MEKINQVIRNLDLGNIYYNFKNLIKYRTVDFFNCVDIETMTQCNRRCSYCPNMQFEDHLPKNNKVMDYTLFKRIIIMLADIRFSGRIEPSFYNEPLLDKRMPKMVRYIHAKIPSSKITIYTNGDYLTIDLFNELVDAGVYEFIISQHSKQPSRNMKLLMKYLKDKPEKRSKIASFDVPIKRDILYNRGGLVSIPQRKPIKMDRCLLPSNFLVINHKGEVILCCNDYFSDVVFGNLNKESLLDVWNKPLYKRIRNQLRKGKFDLDICRKCRILAKVY